jgi:hypothetical protein
MWYTLGQANTFICTPAHGGRAGNAGGRSPVFVRLDRPPLSNPPRQCRGPVDDHHGARPARYRAGRAPCDSCLPPAWPRGVATPFVTSALHGHYLRRRGLRVPPGAAAPQSTYLRQAHQPVDPPAGRRSQFRPSPHAVPGQRRSHPCGPPPVGRVVETRPTLDYESRSGLCPEKNDVAG